MIKNKFNFTKKTIDTLPNSGIGKRAYFYDSKIRGLAAAVTDKGCKTFILYKKVAGKPERITLGRYPDISIENARMLALKASTQIAHGKNPNKERNKIKNEFSFGKLFQEFMEKHSKVHKKSFGEDIAIHRRYLFSLESKKISNIHRADIEKLHAYVGKNNGIYAANHMLALLKTVFNKVVDWGYEGTNPCIGIKKFKERSRERFLQIEELPKFFAALNEELNETLKDFFYISLLSGARRGNVLSMCWRDISFERAIWHIEDTKNSDSINIHLGEEALKILQKRFENKFNEWVFPSLTSKSGHLVEPKSAWKRLLARADIKDLRIHDLRRTLGSWQAATGANSYIIGKSLGHKTQQATAIYARLNLDPVRESVNKATSAMLAFKK